MTNETNEPVPSPQTTAKQDRPDSHSTPPRGNPDTEHGEVEKGKEELDKISGN